MTQNTKKSLDILFCFVFLKTAGASGVGEAAPHAHPHTCTLAGMQSTPSNISCQLPTFTTEILFSHFMLALFE